MCEQTEINYLDGDVVWVKLGACWWPGQVTGFHNLPEDIQIEFQKKPLIAAVKFFQEDTYEFVKNLHQIYKYNCTQKDEFIRKGLDKYRTKSKDGSSYMDKFPGDVEMAEKLTGGDPDILTSEKFCREERPDISALFGEKKLPKKKRDRDEMSRRSDGNVSTRKITHPRFLRESDHEIRIRQQPSSMPNTPKTSSTDSPQFSCNLCSFTTTRVNVIICHRKSHCSGGGLESPLGRGRIVNYAQPRGTGRPSLPADTQKRKYVRKTKSLSSKGKTERESEPVKRKIAKQTDKIAAKKKKTDPELREKLLADWDDETDEDMDLDLNKSADTVSIGSSSAGNNSAPPNNSSDNTEDKEDDGAELIKASEKLLRETEKFASLHVDDSSSRASRHSSNKHLDDLDSETDTSTSTLAKDDKSPAYKKPKKLIATATEERKSTSSEKDDKQSRFSCFDFDEEDLPEPTITPVRKIPRIFGEKNTSVKKEILKKFTMSQAMKSVKNDERTAEEREWEEKAPRVQDFFDKKEPTAKEKRQEDAHEEKDITVRSTVEEESDHAKSKVDTSAKSEETRDKSSKAHTVTELEIVEIFEVEGEKDEREEIDDSKKSTNYEIETFSIGAPDKKSEDNKKEAESEEISDAKNTVVVIDEASRRDTNSQTDKKSTMSELGTTETEDETVSELAESLRGNSENSDTDNNLNQATWGSGLVASATPETSRDELITCVDKPVPRRRGRPRKSLTALESSGNGNDSPKHEMIIGKKVAALATRDSERKTSESDSERSYSGRRRKPNKRYLHSDLYTSSPDNRASKTDESQSETEEKSQKEHKLVRARGGKKKSAVVANDARVEPVEKTTDQEFEFSNRTLATGDQLATTEDSQVSRTDEEVSHLNELPETTKSDNPETEGESSASCLTEFGKKLDSGIGSPVNITKLLSPGESAESSTKNLPSQDSGNEKPTQPENKFSVIETVAMIPEDMELCADETKSGSKYNAIKTSVDKLPPKKSQIKKFELSQIDLLDACEEQVAAEQAAAEKRIAERLKAERLAAEILAAEKLAEEKLEAEKLAAEKLAAEKLAEEKLAAERLAEEKLTAERLAEEKLAAERLAEEKLAAETLAEEKLAAEKLAEEKLATEKLAEEKLVAEKLAEEKLAAEKVAEEKLAEEKLAAEKLAEEKLAAEKLAEEKLAAKKLAEEKLAAAKLAVDKLAEEKLAEEKLAEEKLAAEKLAEEKMVAEKLAAEKMTAEKLAAEKLAEEKMVVEKLAAEELAVAKQALEQSAAEKLTTEQTLAEKAETEKFLQEEEEDKKLADEQRIAEEQETTELKAKIESPEAEIKLQGVDSITDALEEVENEKILSVPVAAAKEDPSPLTTVSVNAGTVTDSTMETIEAVLARITNDEVIDKDKVIGNAEIPDNAGTSDASQIDKSPTKPTIPVDNDASQRTSSMSRYKGAKFPSEISMRGKRAVADEEIPINSFQEAFLKTLHIDKKDEKDEAADGAVRKPKQQQQQLVPSTESAEPQQTFVIAIAGGNNETLVAPASVQETQTVQPLNAMTEFEGVEILVQDNIVEVAAKLDDPSTNQMDLTATLVGTDIKPDVTEALTLDLQKIQDTLSDSVSTPSSPSELGVPVKKREKPRIIENVALKEPMQILKNKLLEKLPGKSTKHKLDTEGHKKPETKGAPRAKMMKMDSGNGKTRSPTKTGGSHFTITRKLQVLKAEEAATAAAIEKEKATAQLAQTMSMPSGGEKFIQASSQSLADMELDINSMPFVLSEDVLTPESIEHMPVVISSIIPSASTSVPTTLSLATSGQLTATNAEVYKNTTSETATTESTTSSTGKKKSGTPAILKNKAKAKPTITSIKTLVPPFAGGGVKGLKFQSQQATGGKAMPLMSQKSATPGKYVIVQTAGGQQMRYSVQGKPGSQQKIAIPAGKATGSAQIVQQGGKVVILTSAQSGQTKMLPLNISKSMSGKVQKIVNNKGQIYAPMNPQAITGQKTIIAPKTDASSPTTSKLVQGQKILNTQGIITSKGVLTPISTSKTGLLGTLSQGIITKGGIYTPISTAQLTGKTLISGKTLVSKATTILSPLGTQALGTSKGTIIAPMSHAITGKTIINAQGIVTPKGTVLTPITGQQVKAIAAKSPAKAAKIHYQPVQQKLQLPMLQKCQKIPVSSSTQQQMRAASNIKSPSGGTIVFPNTASQKTASPAGKKIVRQIGQHGVRSPQQLTLQNASGQQVTQKSKSVGTTATTVQRIATSRGTGRQSKQKIVVQKIHESAADGSPIASAQQVKAVASMASQVGNVTKTPLGGAHKQTPVRAGKSAKNAQKNLLNVIGTSSVATSTMGTNETSMVVSSVIPTPSIASTLQNLPLPPLVIPGTELPLNEAEECPNVEKSLDTPPMKDSTKQEASTKPTTSSSDATTIEEPKLEATTSKITAQPQIMALPTESSDGTQTYVLVTIDEQGQIQPLDNNTLMSLEGTTQNADGTRTLYIDPSSLGEAGTLDNIVLQFDNGALPNLQSNASTETNRVASGTVAAETFPTSEIIQTSNQDILAAALANTDFQQEIGLPDNTPSNVMSAGLTQTSLINQTILQSTIIPPTEPISSPSVLETSLTLNQPIMTPLEVPSNLPIQMETAPPPPPASVVSTIPTSLELPITITNPSISYISAAAVAATSTATHIQIPGNSMPDIGEIMESSVSDDVARTDIPTSTRYLVLPNLDDAVTMQSRDNNESGETSVPVTYSVAIPDNIVIDNTQAQTTPSMPIIDDAYVETPEQSFAEVAINEMLVTKASSAITDSAIVAPENAEPITSCESAETSAESQGKITEAADTMVTEFSRIDSYTDRDAAERMIVEPEAHAILPETSVTTDEKHAESLTQMLIDEPSTQIITTCTPAVEVSHSSSEMQVVENDDSTEKIVIESTNSRTVENIGEEVAATADHSNSQVQENVTSQEEASSVHGDERTGTSSLDSPRHDIVAQVASAGMELESGVATAVAEEAVSMEIYPSGTPETPDRADTVEGSSGAVIVQRGSSDNFETHTEEATETSQEEETPSQSYEQRFDAESRVASDSPETPTQSATKSENSREPTQSVAYEAMEIDESTASGEPPTQSFEDTKRNEASQSYETAVESNTNAPTQSFNEIMQCQEEDDEEPSTGADAIDDQSFPTQSYEVGKIDDLTENLESDASAIGQEQGNQPSQSNDIGNDVGIGTSTVSINNSGLNEDETASSSYVPETPENQERDQDQESAISTSSYEIPSCEELNIASSSVIPDTSVSRAIEHMSIHDNGVPEIPTSSYNLNPDSSSTSRVGDALPTSSYEEDQVIVEQNVSTSYEVPISMPGIEENSSQNFVTESTDHRRNVEQPTSYYAHRHTEVTASFYEAVNQDSNSRLEADPQEEVTPSYYEQPRDVTSEASQSYFRATPRYPSQSVSPSYYDPTPETEASQSSYYSHEIGGTEQSSSRNVEASQSFYQETTDERRLGQQGEATPTYTERYPVDYAHANSPMERHDLVESSVPATRPTER